MSRKLSTFCNTFRRFLTVSDLLYIIITIIVEQRVRFLCLCENVRYCKEQKNLAEQKTEILPFFEEYLATLKRVDELETSLRWELSPRKTPS